jgi:FKBP-type peptidyl-prolyl cis-trans isomerase SlyD
MHGPVQVHRSAEVHGPAKSQRNRARNAIGAMRSARCDRRDAIGAMRSARCDRRDDAIGGCNSTEVCNALALAPEPDRLRSRPAAVRFSVARLCTTSLRDRMTKNRTNKNRIKRGKPSALDPAPQTKDFQVGPAAWVEIGVRVFDADGERVEGTEERFAFVFGFGQVLPGIERALEGRFAHQTCSVELSASEAYGERDEELIVPVARDEFPEDIRPGDRVEVEDADGAILVLRILELSEDEARVDFNHPLAGQKVRFELETLAVRPATAAEIARAERALESETAQTTGLLAPERLLRGAGRRYESAGRGNPAGTTTDELPDGSSTEEKKA